MVDVAAEQQEEVKEEVKDEVKSDDKDAKYWQQQAQQNDANARRERQTREDNEKAATETKAQLTQTSQKLQELEQKVEQKSQYSEMDKDTVDPAVAKNIEALQKQIEGLGGKLNEQTAKITQYEQVEVQRGQDKQYADAVEQICKPLDDKYGQKFRSEARSLADKAVEDGKEEKPSTTLDAYLLHEKFYKQLSEKKDKKKTTPTDNGKGTASVAKGREDSGSYDEVLSEMKARCKT